MDIDQVRLSNAQVLRRVLYRYFFFGVAVIWLIPDGLLSEILNEQSFDIFSVILPALPRLSALTDFPVTAGLWQLLMWITFFFVAHAVAISWALPQPLLNLSRSDQWFLLSMFLLLALLGAWPILFFLSTTPEQVHEASGRGAALMRLAFGSRMGFSLVCSALFCVTAFVVGVAFIFIRTVMLKKLP